MKTKKELLTTMARLYACDDATAWVEKSKLRTTKQLWEACPRADWMLWLAARIGVEQKQLVRAACKIAGKALKHIPEGETRPRVYIETVERWCDGEATLDEVRAAQSASNDFRRYAYAAAYAAAYATCATYDATYDAADSAVYAAYADSAAYAGDPAAAAARKKSLRRSAKLVRQVITWSDIKKAVKS